MVTPCVGDCTGTMSKVSPTVAVVDDDQPGVLRPQGGWSNIVAQFVVVQFVVGAALPGCVLFSTFACSFGVVM